MPHFLAFLSLLFYYYYYLSKLCTTVGLEWAHNPTIKNHMHHWQPARPPLPHFSLTPFSPSCLRRMPPLIPLLLLLLSTHLCPYSVIPIFFLFFFFLARFNSLEIYVDKNFIKNLIKHNTLICSMCNLCIIYCYLKI